MEEIHFRQLRRSRVGLAADQFGPATSRNCYSLTPGLSAVIASCQTGCIALNPLGPGSRITALVFESTQAKPGPRAWLMLVLLETNPPTHVEQQCVPDTYMSLPHPCIQLRSTEL